MMVEMALERQNNSFRARQLGGGAHFSYVGRPPQRAGIGRVRVS